MKPCRGVEIAEYGLILALLVLISVPALMFMGEQLSSSYNNMNPTGKASELFALLGGGAGGNSQNPDPISADDQDVLTDTLASKDTSVPGLTQPSDHSTISQSITVNQAMGTTFDELISQGFKATSAEGIMQSVGSLGAGKTAAALASNLEDLIEQMESAGEMTAEEANHFRQLANQGHKIAQIEQIIEQAGERFDGTTPWANSNQFMAQQVEYNGMTVSVGQLSTLIDFPGGMPTNWYDHLYTGHVNTSNDFYNNNNNNNELSKFVDMYQDSQKLSVLQNNRQLYDYVYSLSSTIVMTSEQVGSLEFQTGNEQTVRDSLAQPLSDKAHLSSSNICGVGQGSDSGTSCQ